MHNVTASELRRDLGLLDAVGIGFGAIIGAGIFVVTGVAAGVAGPAFVAGLSIAGLAAAANALSAAQLASAYPRAGGTYEYGYRVLNPTAGFAAGWLYLASKIAAAGTVAMGLGGYLESLLPAVPPRLVAVTAVVLFTVLNYVGVRRSSRMNLWIVSVSVGVLVLFVIVGAGEVRGENLRPFAPAGVRGVLEAAALLFFAYTGYARIAVLAEEVRDPRRTIPRAVVATITGAIVLYMAVAIVAVGVVGSERMAATAAPLHVAARSFSVPGIPVVVSVGALAAMLGVILSQLLGLSRMGFAMARWGDLPAVLARVDTRFRTPGAAIIAVGIASTLVTAVGTLQGVAAAAAFTILLYYAITNVAALRMPREARLYPVAIPSFGLVACVVLAASLSPRTILTGLAVLLVGLVARHVVRRRPHPSH